jgi:hypothetical protein
MKFFIPAARNEAEAEHVWAAVRHFLAANGYPTTARRIRRIAFCHHIEHFDLEIGGHHPGMEDDPPLTAEPEHPLFRCLVMVILEASNRPCFYLCMPYRGVIRGDPWLVGRGAVIHVEEFEP